MRRSSPIPFCAQFSTSHPLGRNVVRFRERLVVQAHRLLHLSTLGSRVMKKQTRSRSPHRSRASSPHSQGQNLVSGPGRKSGVESRYFKTSRCTRPARARGVRGRGAVTQRARGVTRGNGPAGCRGHSWKRVYPTRRSKRTTRCYESLDDARGVAPQVQKGDLRGSGGSTSPTRKRNSLGPYRKPIRRVPGGSVGVQGAWTWMPQRLSGWGQGFRSD